VGAKKPQSKPTVPETPAPSLACTDEQKELLAAAHDGMMLYGVHPAVQTAVKTEVERLLRGLGMNAIADQWHTVAWG